MVESLTKSQESYRKQLELQQILSDNGLQVIESRFVRAGHFEESLPEDHDNAKEILFVVEKQ